MFGRILSIQRSKTEAGRRSIPLNDDAMQAFKRLLERAETFGGGTADQFVFPACENGSIDFSRNQRTFRTAWRKLVAEAALQAGKAAARAQLDAGRGIGAAKAAWKRAGRAFAGLRFHDLRHQSITEMAEAGVPEAAMQSIAGHLSKKMLDHYSRMVAKRSAVEALGSGLMLRESNLELADKKPN